MATSGTPRSVVQSVARSGKTRQALVDAAIDALRDVGFAPWHAFAEAAVNKASAAWPLRSVVPVGDIAHAVVAGVLGLELLASLDADHARAEALLDHAAGIALLLSATPRPSKPT